MTAMNECDTLGTDPAGLRRVLAVIDFDGTVTAGDCMETLLRRHVADWPRLTEATRGGRLSPAAALEEGVGRLRIPREQILREFAEAAVLRPGFGEFLDWLLGAGGRAAIVSVGFREGIEAVWRRERLAAIPLFAAELRGDGGTGFGLQLHDSYGDCPICGTGRCKAAVVRELRRDGDLVVAFGDGARDLCLAREADIVFARARLTDLCDREGLAWRPLDDFTAVARDLAGQIARIPAGDTPRRTG
jgi:2-hydroxy-3-keto-5-methylthiopentenyl-1-phosphate phosphatase